MNSVGSLDLSSMVQNAVRASSVPRLALLATGIAWIPLLLFSAASGPVAIRLFLFDFALQSRLLILIPLLILMEPVLLVRFAMIARHFSSAHMVRAPDEKRFDEAFSTFVHGGHSSVAQLVLDVVVCSMVTCSIVYFWPEWLPGWCYANSGSISMSGAGIWYVMVSLPIILSIVIRWIWHLARWSAFLQAVSRMRLRLIASHPDLMGGLSFIETYLSDFQPFAFAIGVLAAGGVANQIRHHHQSLYTFRHVPLVVVAVVLILAIAPVCVFSAPMFRARTRGVFTYGSLASRMGQLFENKWLFPEEECESSPLGVQDFSAAIDLYSVTANVRQMRLIPVSATRLGYVVAITLVPAIPVILLGVPFDVMFERVVKLLF
jgi:hypothetical protein